MTELQKLSLKKLRKMKTPLFVMDKKSNKQGFVILEIAAFEKALKTQREEKRTETKETKKIPDYRTMGLLWDRSDITNDRFHALLKKSVEAEEWERIWAARRLLEYAPSMVVKEIFSLDELKEILSKVKLKPFYQEAWNHAVHYWSENS